MQVKAGSPSHKLVLLSNVTIRRSIMGENLACNTQNNHILSMYANTKGPSWRNEVIKFENFS